MDLKGKACLITGGTSGIGAATAILLAQHGAHVAVASRSQENVRLLKVAVESAGGKFAFIQADIAKTEDCIRCVNEANAALGRLDILVHSAGGAAPGGLMEVTEEAWQKAFDVHVHAIFRLCRVAVPLMKAKKEGAIVLISSAAGLRGCLGALAYSVVKGALPQFARALARELADDNIRVNCVSPGVIRTPFQDILKPEQAKNNIENRIPLHREGQPEDVARVIAELVCNEFITGENLVIDGGLNHADCLIDILRMDTMKALQLTQYKHLEIVNLPIPSVAPDEVLIAIRACGICGSDVHGYDGSTGRRIPPMVMGHEAAGVIAAIGNSVTDLRVGERVTFDSTVYCGECFFCKRGQINLCDFREVVGVSTPDFRRMGAFAEYVAVPRRIVHRLPENMPFAYAALIEAVSVAVHAISLTNIEPNDTSIVVGAGMIGLLTLQAARLAGSKSVVVIDIDDTRLATARMLGATHTLNSATDDIAAAIRQLTDGRGADVALECVGTMPTVELAIENVRKGGTVTLVGNIAPVIEIGLQSVVTRQIRLQGSCASAGEYPASIDLMSRGDIRIEPLLTVVAPLEEGAAWFERLYNREPGLMKIVLEPAAVSL